MKPLSPDTRSAIVADLHAGMDDTAAAKKHGVHRKTVAKIRREEGIAPVPNRGRPPSPASSRSIARESGVPLRQARKLAKKQKN